jgi:mannosyltransferase
MSVPADASQPRARVETRGVVERLRASTLVLDVALVSGVSLVLGLIRLGSPALWYDEAYTFRQIRKGYLEQFDGYQPFFYWIVKPWTDVAGTSEWALRFPSVVGAMLAAALLVVLARRLFDRRVALVSGLLLATSPYVVKWSQQARVYPFLAALGIAATLLLLRALDRGTRAAWLAYGLAYTGLLVTHAVVGLLLVPAHAVLVAQRRRRVLPHGLLAAVVIVALGLPWVGQLALRTGGETSETAWIPYPSAEYVRGALTGVSGVAGLGLLLALLGLWFLRRAGDRQLAVWLGSWAFGPFVLALVISLARPVFLDRYLVIAAPAFAMLAAVGVLSVAGRLRAGVVVLAAVATGIGLALWYQTSDDGNWRGEDWRGAVETVLARSGEAEAVVVVPWWAHDAAEYYGAPARDVSTADSVWVLHWSESGADIPRAVRSPLGFGEHVLAERVQFGWRLTAQLWRRPAD